MLLRRITEHVKAQNWFAVGLDFIIVVVGVFMGLQVQQWANERERRNSERQYLYRLHEEVEKLVQAREIYNETRQQIAASLFESTTLINSDDQTAKLTADQCRIVAHSSFTTVPPSDLPSAAELLSSGRLDQIAAPDLRESILGFVQDAGRVRDLIVTISDSNVELGRAYPDLIRTQAVRRSYMTDPFDLVAACNLADLRKNPAFMNDLNSNAYMYNVYWARGILGVTEKLATLHTLLDRELSIRHAPATGGAE